MQVKGDLLLVAAGNSRQMARMLAVAPDAMLDDGLLDVTLLLGTISDQVHTSAPECCMDGRQQHDAGYQHCSGRSARMGRAQPGGGGWCM